MILHPDFWSDLTHLQHQDRLREVETWRLAVEAQRGRARFLRNLLHRLIAAARQRLGVQARPNSATPMADLPR